VGGTPTASQAADADSADSAALGSRTGVLALALIKVSRRRPAYAQTVVNLRTSLRRFLRRIGLGRRPTSRKAPKPRAAAVVVDGDQVLVVKRHKRGRNYAVLPGGGVEEGETAAQAALRELHEETTLLAEIDRLLWTGRHNNRPAWYFLMTAIQGHAELSGSEASENRPDNSFELHWITADQVAELGLHPPDIRGPLAALLANRSDLA
jgi:ADP-ribose pyrophosphatase YjhB (NUDIX family)